MKYSITYARKIQIRPYQMLEVSLTAEFDTAETDFNRAKEIVKAHVDSWIEIEKERLQKQ